MKTSLYSILCIVIRVVAILLIANTVLAFPSLYAAMGNMSHPDYARAWLYYLTATDFLIGASLWIYPGVLARLAVSKSGHDVFESPLSPLDFQRIAFSILGAWFVLNGLIDVAHDVFHMFTMADPADGMSIGIAFEAESVKFVTSTARFLLGVILMFGARGLVGLINRMRYRGSDMAAMDKSE